MAFTLNAKKPIRRELKQIARKALRRAGEHLRDDHEKAVHQARKSVKKVRAIVDLLQEIEADSFEKPARQLRATGRTLSVLRDADAVIATFDHLRARFAKRLPEHTYAIMRGQLIRAKA